MNPDVLLKSITHRNQEYRLMLITKTNIYYCNPEDGDDNSNTICFDLDMNLLSDNCHAGNAFFTCMKENDFVWGSDEMLENMEELRANGQFDEVL